MKLIVAIIKPFKLDEVRQALTEIGVIGVREEAALEPSFWGQFPGNTQYIPRKSLISSYDALPR